MTRFHSTLFQAARHGQHLARQVFRVRRRQIDCGRRGIVRQSHASDGSVRLDHLLEVASNEAGGVCVPSVSIIPGLIEFTRIFRGPSSLASTPVIASTAAFDAASTDDFGVCSVLATEPMLMMLPPGPMYFTASLVVSRRPRTLTSKCLWNSWSTTPACTSSHPSS